MVQSTIEVAPEGCSYGRSSARGGRQGTQEVCWSGDADGGGDAVESCGWRKTSAQAEGPVMLASVRFKGLAGNASRRSRRWQARPTGVLTRGEEEKLSPELVPTAYESGGH